jgi:hypothetical protein
MINWQCVAKTAGFARQVLFCVIACTWYSTATDQSLKPSLKLSCNKVPFVSVSVSTLRRNQLPHVEVQLTDPQQRHQGFGVSANVIPRSQYAIVAQVADEPNISTVHAVEVCGAEEGLYEVRLVEPRQESYRLSVRVGDEFLDTTLHGRENGVRRYKFSFVVNPAKNTVNLGWIDKNGKPQPYLDADE